MCYWRIDTKKMSLVFRRTMFWYRNHQPPSLKLWLQLCCEDVWFHKRDWAPGLSLGMPLFLRVNLERFEWILVFTFSSTINSGLSFPFSSSLFSALFKCLDHKVIQFLWSYSFYTRIATGKSENKMPLLWPTSVYFGSSSSDRQIITCFNYKFPVISA